MHLSFDIVSPANNGLEITDKKILWSLTNTDFSEAGSGNRINYSTDLSYVSFTHVHGDDIAEGPIFYAMYTKNEAGWSDRSIVLESVSSTYAPISLI